MAEEVGRLYIVGILAGKDPYVVTKTVVERNFQDDFQMEKLRFRHAEY